MSARRKHSNTPAANWWKAAADTFMVLADYIHMAKRAERRDEGHECGHTFRIQVSGRLHSSDVVTDNPPTHSDANWWHDDGTVEVRAHNLRDALLIAATLPITDWPGLNEGEARS